MRIASDRTLEELQIEFNSRFPYLKLEFYSCPHTSGKGTLEQYRLEPDRRIREVQQKGSEGELPLEGGLLTGRFEELLQERFGLNAQVFRLSYGTWMQTWATDVWTLDEQNQRGEIMGERGVYLT